MKLDVNKDFIKSSTKFVVQLRRQSCLKMATKKKMCAYLLNKSVQYESSCCRFSAKKLPLPLGRCRKDFFNINADIFHNDSSRFYCTCRERNLKFQIKKTKISHLKGEISYMAIMTRNAYRMLHYVAINRKI